MYSFFLNFHFFHIEVGSSLPTVQPASKPELEQRTASKQAEQGPLQAVSRPTRKRPDRRDPSRKIHAISNGTSGETGGSLHSPRQWGPLGVLWTAFFRTKGGSSKPGGVRATPTGVEPLIKTGFLGIPERSAEQRSRLAERALSPLRKGSGFLTI